MSFRPLTLALRTSLLLGALLATGCRAQTPVSPELARRIELMIRSRANLPFSYDVKVGERRKGTMAGYDELTVVIGETGTPGKPVSFLLSQDEKTLAQMTTFDLTRDPKQLVGDAGRPSRGGSENAPVKIVVFDDLQCPFCARMHAQLFPAVLERYGDKVRISYKDFPLQQHDWAIHAAVDANCLGAQSANGYWDYVDYLHAHAGEMRSDNKDVASIQTQLDKLAIDMGTHVKADSGKLQACLKAQDQSSVNAGLREGEQLNVNGVPALFVNGEQIDGAVPIEFVYRAIDAALVAQKIQPPPPVPLPALPGAGAAGSK